MRNPHRKRYSVQLTSMRDITPMEITHPVVGVINETNGLDHEANKVNGSSFAISDTAMQTTERRRDGTNLRTWKRMARVEHVATWSRDAGQSLKMKRKNDITIQEGEDIQGGKKLRTVEGGSDST
jgi:hypothetical protein